MQKIFLGGAYEQLDEDAQEALQHVSNAELHIDIIQPEDTKQQLEFDADGARKEETKSGHPTSGIPQTAT